MENKKRELYPSEIKYGNSNRFEGSPVDDRPFLSLGFFLATITMLIILLSSCGAENVYVQNPEGTQSSTGKKENEITNQDPGYSRINTEMQEVEQCVPSYELEEQKGSWEEAMMNYPKDMRLATRAEVIELFDSGIFEWARFENIMVWTSSFTYNDLPWAVHLGSGVSLGHTMTGSFSALYINDCQ